MQNISNERITTGDDDMDENIYWDDSMINFDLSINAMMVYAYD